jgi:hypothetical protein
MRAGPLSQSRIIETLNSYFVPAYLSWEDYSKDGAAMAAEKQAFWAMYQEAARSGLSVGTVHAYVLAPDGAVLSTQHVASAVQSDRLYRMLRSAIERLDLRPGSPVSGATTQSRLAGPVPADAVVLHLVARYTSREGSWREFPSENWLVLLRPDWERLTPSGPLATGDTWRLDRFVTASLLIHVYPQTENNDANPGRLQECQIDAAVIEADERRVRIRLDGTLVMKHPFYPNRDDANHVRASLVGLLDVDPRTRYPLDLRLATDGAKYGRDAFLAAMWAVPRP